MCSIKQKSHRDWNKQLRLSQIWHSCSWFRLHTRPEMKERLHTGTLLALWKRAGADENKEKKIEKKKRKCSLLVHMAIRSEAKLPGLIQQQQPACLLTVLWAFAAAQMPRGRFAWLQFYPSVSLSSFVSPVLVVLRDRATLISCLDFWSKKNSYLRTERMFASKNNTDRWTGTLDLSNTIFQYIHHLMLWYKQ